jgi:hypothetical protein
MEKKIRIFFTLYPRSGIEKFGSGIRYEHLLSATLFRYGTGTFLLERSGLVLRIFGWNIWYRVIESRSVVDPWHFGADPYLWLTDPGPTPDPTPFFSDFKDAKKLIFSYFF